MIHLADVDRDPVAIVLVCFDHRLPSTFWDFLTKDCNLKKGQFYLMKIAGGPAPFAHPVRLKDRLAIITADFSLVFRNCPSVNRIILINHQGCLFYREYIPNQYCDMQIEKSDLPKAKITVRDLWPEKKVEVYHAKKINGNGEVYFENP